MSRKIGVIETVVWDFNGTLVDDLDLVVRTVNVQLEKRNLPILTVDDYRRVFGFPVEDYYRRLGVTFENESMADLSTDFFADYAPALRDCSLHEGVVDTLRTFAGRGVTQYVLSAMEQGMLLEMMDHFEIRDYFEAVYGLAHQEGDSKIERGLRLMAEHRIGARTALLVGDTDHDAEVAEALGTSVALVAAGHQSIDRLQTIGCPVYASLEQLASRFAEVSKTGSV